jgi:serine/threonine-protein kinase
MNDVSVACAGPSPGEDYRLVRVRGQGGFGRVWEARTPEGEAVALKFLPCSSDRAAAEEVRNLQAVSRMPHPHLLPVRRVWADRGCVVAVMDLADGSLLDLLDISLAEFGGPVPADQVCQYLAQAADALDFLNGRRPRPGVQHGDLKPANLLLFGDTVRVCDFGLAGRLAADVVAHRPVGTPEYAAPEVFRGKRSRWTDQYALAVSYCELRGGRLPFADTPDGFRAGYVRPEPDLSMVDPAERPLLARALARTPQDRWPSCGDLLGRLAAAVAPAGATDGAGTIPASRGLTHPMNRPAGMADGGKPPETLPRTDRPAGEGR